MSRRMVDRTRAYRVQIGVLVALWAVCAATTPAFQRDDGVYAVLLGFALIGLVALGVTATMIAGELDISVAAVAGTSAAIAIRFSSLGLWPAVIATTAVAAAFGFLQGAAIARLRINSLVFTLGTLVVLGGVTFVLCGGQSLAVSNFDVSTALFVRWGVFGPDSAVALAMFVLLGLFFGFVKYGREIYAIGGARNEALAAGVSARRPIIIAFTISATCAGLAGALAGLKAGTTSAEAFSPLLLQAISAALVGGISLTGGRGSVVNVFLGVAILSLISAALAMHGAADYVVQLTTGGILLLVVVLEFLSGVLQSARDPTAQIGGPRQQATAAEGAT